MSKLLISQRSTETIVWVHVKQAVSPLLVYVLILSFWPIPTQCLSENTEFTWSQVAENRNPPNEAYDYWKERHPKSHITAVLFVWIQKTLVWITGNSRFTAARRASFTRKHELHSASQNSTTLNQASITNRRRGDSQPRIEHILEVTCFNCLMQFSGPMCSNSLLEQMALFDQE